MDSKLNKYKKSLSELAVYKYYKKHLKQPLTFVSSIISWTIFSILIIAAAFLIYYFISSQIYARKGAGYEPAISLYTIISPSMVPNINVYDVVIVNDVDSPDEIKPGDIISFNSADFRPGETISVTHRVVEVMVDKDGNYSYYTKGDNNFVKDPKPVAYGAIMGKVTMKIPQLGRIQFFLASSYGWLLLIVVPALYVIAKSVVKALRVSGIAEKIPRNSKLFPIFNKPLLLTHKNIYSKEDISETPIAQNSIIEKKEYSQNRTLEEIYEDLKNLTEK